MLIKNTKVLLLLSLLLGNIYFAKAQDTLRLSLQDAVAKAMQNNIAILNSEIDLEIAQKKIWETTASGLPHLDLKTAYTFYPKVPSLPATFFDPAADPNAVVELGVKQNVVADLTLSQLIFNGAYFVGLQASKAYYKLSEQNNEKTRLEVIESVVNTYHMLQLAEESSVILAQNLENITKTKSEIEEMFKQGFVEKTDVDQLQVAANTIRNALNEIESNLQTGYNLLKIQLSLTDVSLLDLKDPLESDEALTQTSIQLLSAAFNLENNVDYQLIKSAEKMAQLDLKLAMSSFLPNIVGYYNHTEKLKAPLFDFAPKDLVGVNLSFPIFSSGQRLATLAQKRMNLEKSQNNQKFVSENILMQANQYQSDVKLKLEKYLNMKVSKELSEDIYSRTLEKYKQGMATSMDLMNSHNQFLVSLTNYYQSIYNLQSAKSKLEKLFNLTTIENQ
jgi:outer membrane protein TolC